MRRRSGDDRHFLIDELGDVAASPASDPRRGHLSDCPKCRALLAAYHDFMAPADLLPDGELARAQQHLAAAVRREIDAAATPAGLVEQNPADRPLQVVPAKRTSVRPFWRLSLVAAALIVVGLGIGRILWQDGAPAGEGAPGGYVLRGDAPKDEIAVTPARFTARGLLHLAWRQVPGADEFRVALHAADLTSLTTVTAGRDTAIDVDPTAVKDSEAGPVRFWRVIALRGGDEIAGSPLQPLPALP